VRGSVGEVENNLIFRRELEGETVTVGAERIHFTRGPCVRSLGQGWLGSFPNWDQGRDRIVVCASEESDQG